VPARALEPGPALDLLLADPAALVANGLESVDGAPPARLVLADSFRFWGEVARVAVELVAQGRVVPTVEERDEAVIAVWRPALRAEDAERIALLAANMPAVCRAEWSSAEGGGAVGAGPRAIVDAALGALVDACAREALDDHPLLRARGGDSSATRPAAEAWLAAVVAADPVIQARATELETLRQAVGEWAGTAVPPPPPAVRLCFRLQPPAAQAIPARSRGDARAGSRADGAPTVATESAPGGIVADITPIVREASLADAPPGRPATWRLEFLLPATADRTLLIPAAEVWRARGRKLRALRRRVEDPQDQLLAALGRALQLYPGLAPALRTAAPVGLDLDTAAAYHFLRETSPILEEAGFGVFVPSWWTKPTARLGLRLRARPQGEAASSNGLLGLDALCDYAWEAALGDTTLSLDELQHLARLKLPLVQHRGEWIELRGGEVEAALRLMQDQNGARPLTAAEALRLGLGIGDYAPADLPIVGIDGDGWIGELLDAAGAQRLQPVPTPAGFVGELRPYQLRGLAWLGFLDRLGLGACLADDMGLGKTIQLLALLLAEPLPAPTLLICPMSVAGNWQREAARFAPGLRVHLHHGGERLSGEAFAEAVGESDIVITTYALALRDRAALTGIEWGRVVLDEAQNIKNSASQQARAIRAIPAPRRIALTGTPVENRLSELWAIMEFLNPGLLGRASEFRTRFTTPIERYHDEARAIQLRRLTAPFILRRLKTDRSIIRDLPEQVEIKVYCNLTREQATLYQAVVDDMLQKIETSRGIERKGLVLTTILKLKQVCNHPAHLLGDNSPLADRSGKLARLEETLEEVLAAGDRALVFTQFAEFGHALRTHLQERFGREIPFLHGGTTKKTRDEMVSRFQGDDGPPILLLSLRAGGTGLNLTAANHVIHFDRWWNPAVEDQATDRAFRIGQERRVQARKFICVGTIEERIDQMIEAKKDLAERIVGAGEAWLTELSTTELHEIVALGGDAVVE
jgi:non-specific serine/threonine protein kinase